jgi:mannose-1-phosphate guanylyltransferase / phosphomannomutase
MKAVIMAGGEGTRLRPLTNLRPKPMVPVANRPVMEHILRLVKWHGIHEVVATLQYLPQVIENHFGDGSEWDMDMTYALEDRPLGTAGSVKNAADALKNDSFIVISGDSLTDFDLGHVIDFHKEKGAAVTIALQRVSNPLEFGVVITDDNGKVKRFLEKPTWGQVFSDTINTGIYVVEPEVLEHIPPGEPYDFSSELFPKLMKKGYPIYGCVEDGYWCDIGSLGSYIQANRDALDGSVGLWIPGVKTAGDVWIGESAEVDPAARIGDHVVVGGNAKVKAGADIGAYTVLGDNCYVGVDATVSHAVVWNNVFVGARSVVRGAVLQSKTDVRAGATIEMGAVIGDESMIGHGALIANDVQVYPFKRIEPGAVISSSVIWENRAASSLFGVDGVSGIVNVDVSPELALSLAQAYGSTLPSGSHVVVSRDASRAGRMVKRAMIAGLNATGVNVRDLRVTSPAINRFTTRETRCQGGIHVNASGSDVATIEIHFYDKQGLDLTPGDEKKVERLYFRNEFRRSFFDEIGEIIYPPRALEYYTAGLAEALGRHSGAGLAPGAVPRLKVVADMAFGMASLVMPSLAAQLSVDLVALSPFLDSERTFITPDERADALDDLSRVVRAYSPDFGVAIDAPAERVTLVTRDGVVLDMDTALHALVELWCAASPDNKVVGVPVSASTAVDTIAEHRGCTVVRTGRSRRQLSNLALTGTAGFVGGQRGGYIFPEFQAAFDAVMTVGMLARLIGADGRTLDQVVETLPPFHLRRASLFCPYGEKGTVMRAMAEATAGMEVEMTDGIKLFRPDGWVLLLPHPVEPRVDLFAEGPDEAASEAILEEFAGLVETTLAEQ